jgi:metal-responsive CopG/Arc/MetJ family transcriptional regulator
MNRSEVIRAALQHYVQAHERLGREAEERRILSKHRAVLDRQLEALVDEQAER